MANQNILDRLSRENGIRRTAVEMIGGRWYQEQKEATAQILDVAYQRGPALVPTNVLMQKLGEVDDQLLDLLVRSQGWRILRGVNFGTKLRFTEQDRLRVVWESRYYYHYDVQSQNAVQMWTDFGFGQRVSIEPKDKEANKIWKNFWKAPKNKPLLRQRRIQKMSNDQVVDGEQFFEFSGSTIDGKTTIRRVATDEIIKVIYEDDDPDIPLWYLRRTNQGQVFYPDWEAKRSYNDVLEAAWEELKKAGGEPKRADHLAPEITTTRGGLETKGPSTDVVIQKVTFEEIDGRGWPQFRRVFEWSRALKNFLGDRMTLARAVAATVDEVIVNKGGSRAVNATRDDLGTTVSQAQGWLERNPPPAAGSTWVHNKAMEVKRRPLTTGASDAESDAFMVLGQISAGTKVPVHWSGFPGAMQNRATARESSLPFIQQMERYQTFWNDVFQEWVEIVLWFDELYGSKKKHDPESIITLQLPMDLDTEQITGLMNGIVQAIAQQAISREFGEDVLKALIIVALEDFGIQDLQSFILKPSELEKDDDGGVSKPSVEPLISPEALGTFSTVEQQLIREVVGNFNRKAEWLIQALAEAREEASGTVSG